MYVLFATDGGAGANRTGIVSISFDTYKIWGKWLADAYSNTAMSVLAIGVPAI